MNKQNLTILWLDDLREPNKYFKEKKTTGAFLRNKGHYDRLMQKYNLNFVWVKNFDEFTKYVLENGIPEFVSFDRDLRQGNGISSGVEYPSGEDCARWLVEYCRKNGKELPRYFAHSANKNGRNLIDKEMNTPISIGAEDIQEMVKKAVSRILNEGVYVNSLKGNKAMLSYNKNGRNKGNKIAADYLKTDLMDQNGADTYEVPLKGGITSYNITSIKGMEVMHYFKRHFDNEKTIVTVKDDDNNKKDYELDMLEQEFREFMGQFKRKINFVVDYCVNGFKKQNPDINFSAVSIYPVPSSSRFNQSMANELKSMDVIGLPVQVINQDLLSKDLRNLQKDTEFIEKNKEFFNSPMSPIDDMPQSVETYLNKNINKLKVQQGLKHYIDEMNADISKILTSINNFKSNNSSKTLSGLVETYRHYFDTWEQCKKEAIYDNPITKRMSSIEYNTIAEPKKYSKGPSIDARTDYVWQLIKKYLRGEKCPINGKSYKKLDIQYWDFHKFQIKNLSNGERMGVKNIYNPNIDTELVQKELERIKGTIFVIFDDNVSGGATLSDICYQCKELGIENIIPITFGKMAEKWSMGAIPLNKPKNGTFNF